MIKMRHTLIVPLLFLATGASAQQATSISSSISKSISLNAVLVKGMATSESEGAKACIKYLGMMVIKPTGKDQQFTIYKDGSISEADMKIVKPIIEKQVTCGLTMGAMSKEVINAAAGAGRLSESALNDFVRQGIAKHFGALAREIYSANFNGMSVKRVTFSAKGYGQAYSAFTKKTTTKEEVTLDEMSGGEVESKDVQKHTGGEAAEWTKKKSVGEENAVKATPLSNGKNDDADWKPQTKESTSNLKFTPGSTSNERNVAIEKDQMGTYQSNKLHVSPVLSSIHAELGNGMQYTLDNGQVTVLRQGSVLFDSSTLAGEKITVSLSVSKNISLQNGYPDFPVDGRG